MLQIKDVIAKATERIVENISVFGNGFPYAGEDHAYILRENDNWTAGFLAGIALVGLCGEW